MPFAIATDPYHVNPYDDIDPRDRELVEERLTVEELLARLGE